MKQHPFLNEKRCSTQSKHKKGAIMGSAEALCWSFEQLFLFFYGGKAPQPGKRRDSNTHLLFLHSPAL